MINLNKHILQVSSIHMNGQGPELEHVVKDHMRQTLANELVVKFMKRDYSEYHTEFRMKIVAMSPDDFAKIIQEEAMQYMRYLR